MAGIDKTWCQSIIEHDEFKKWARENKFTTPLGEVIDFTCCMYRYDSSLEDLMEELKINRSILVMNTNEVEDYYLIKYCPIKFVQDRMKKIYSQHYENIIDGTSSFDSFNRNSIAGTKVKCIYESKFGKKDFLYKRKGKNYLSDYWIDVDDSSTDYWLGYNENLNHWTICGKELEYHGSNVCHKQIKSRKALIRQIRKWRLPKGCVVRWRGVYQGDEMLFKIY